MNVLPSPGALCTRISPPSRRASSRLMERPRPVPPYSRLVVPSACWNASKIRRCLLAGMPMPVSITEKAITRSACDSAGWPALQPEVAGSTFSVTAPRLVNLKALDSRLVRICCSRLPSVSTVAGSRSSTCTWNSSPLSVATCRTVRST